MAFDFSGNPELEAAMRRHRDDPIGTLSDEVTLL